MLKNPTPSVALLWPPWFLFPIYTLEEDIRNDTLKIYPDLVVGVFSAGVRLKALSILGKCSTTKLYVSLVSLLGMSFRTLPKLTLNFQGSCFSLLSSRDYRLPDVLRCQRLPLLDLDLLSVACSRPKGRSSGRFRIICPVLYKGVLNCSSYLLGLGLVHREEQSCLPVLRHWILISFYKVSGSSGWADPMKEGRIESESPITRGR